MVYSVTANSLPPYCLLEIKGRPMALCLVWWVMVYATSPMPHSRETCSMICVFPTPGGPSSSTGRWRMEGIS